jgi:hypothetical protein
VAGSGGEDLEVFSRTTPLTEVRTSNTFGVLDLTLHATSYDWRFVPQQGGTFFDSGSAFCH